MKKLMGLSLALAMFSACDKIADPLQEYVPPVVTKRTVLLEDYTGQQCGNCPSAADAANTLKKQYGENLVVIAVHAGYFSIPDKNFPNDYRTPAGNAWNTHFGISSYPNGMVNRKNFNNEGIVVKETKWPDNVYRAINEPFIVDLEINPIYGATDSLAGAEVTAIFEKEYPGSVKLIVVLTEDSVIGDQVDYRPNMPKLNHEYVFSHVMRGTLNGDWGTLLKRGPIPAGSEKNVSFSQFRLKAGWKHKNMHVVAFVYDETTREVLQAAETKLTGPSAF